ncbi:MAG: DUF697 domain-containing protein [Bacteriovoracaceae bacterium]
MSKEMDDIQRAKESLENLNSELNLTDEERSALTNELNSIQEMIDKIDNGTVEIAVFGEVSSGKSSLLNALLGEKAFEVGARNGVTVVKGKREWDLIKHTSSSIRNSRVVLVDTPGINEVNGLERKEIAEETIRDSDLVLFVVKGDMNDTEYEALKLLHSFNKPVIVAFNKVDVFTKKQREEVIEALTQKLNGLVNPQNIVLTAGDPNEREVIVEKPDGSEESVLKKPKPIIEDLKLRMLEILESEGKAIVAMNAALFASGIDDRIMAKKMKYRKKMADQLVMYYAIAKGIAIMANPIPLADMVGGFFIDVKMVHAIGKVYGIEMTFKGGQDLMKAVGKSMGLLGAAEIGTHLVATVSDIFSLGSTTVITAPIQGYVAAKGSYIIGSASHYYFAHGSSWGEKGARTVVQEIMNKAKKDGVFSELKEGVKDALKNKFMDSFDSTEENQAKKAS